MRKALQRMTGHPPLGAMVTGLFGGILIAALWVYMAVNISDDFRDTRARRVRQGEILVLAFEEQVVRLMQQAEQLGLLLKRQYEKGDTRINVATLVPDGVVDARTFTAVAVADERGDVITASSGNFPANLADRAYFAAHRQSTAGAMRIGEPVLGPSSGRWAFPLTRRIDKPDGSFGGVALVAVDASRVVALFEQSGLGAGDVMALVRADGIVLARRLGNTDSFGEDVGKSALMTELARSPVGSYTSEGALDKARKFFSYRKLADYPLIVTVGKVESDALAAAWQRAWKDLVIAVLATLFVAGFCALFIAMLYRQRRDIAQIRDQSQLIHRARDAIVVRSMDDRALFWNMGAERIYGWTAAEVAGKPIAEVLHSAPEKMREAWAAVLKSEEWTGQVTHRHRDGREVTVEDRWTLLRDDLGRPKSVLSIKTDISERLDVEARLRQAQRLEAIGQLTGGVAHDFNNLLTVILGNTEMLTGKLRSDPHLSKLAEMTFAAASRGAELTSRLLAFARRQALDPRAIDVNSLLKPMDALLRRTLPQNIEIELVQGAGLWPALVDPGQLEDAILNLCLNARDAMPRGGRLTIETANARIDQDYAAQHDEVDPGQYVLVTVTDNGSGIPASDLGRVFDPFFTTKKFGQGTGLGLSMVYGFVKQSQGHIKIYSEVGQGTAVKAYLPRATDVDAPGEPLPPPIAECGGTESILLVEDDEYVLAYARDQLTGLGYRVTTAKDGNRALEIVRGPDPIDLLFTDVVMPGGLGGRELAEMAVAVRPGLKVLFTSGYTENSIVHHGRLDPGVQLLSKPYRRIDLMQKVRAVLDRNAS